MAARIERHRGPEIGDRAGAVDRQRHLGLALDVEEVGEDAVGRLGQRHADIDAVIGLLVADGDVELATRPVESDDIERGIERTAFQPELAVDRDLRAEPEDVLAERHLGYAELVELDRHRKIRDGQRRRFRRRQVGIAARNGVAQILDAVGGERADQQPTGKQRPLVPVDRRIVDPEPHPLLVGDGDLADRGGRRQRAIDIGDADLPVRRRQLPFDEPDEPILLLLGGHLRLVLRDERHGGHEAETKHHAGGENPFQNACPMPT